MYFSVNLYIINTRPIKMLHKHNFACYQIIFWKTDILKYLLESIISPHYSGFTHNLVIMKALITKSKSRLPDNAVDKRHMLEACCLDWCHMFKLTLRIWIKMFSFIHCVKSVYTKDRLRMKICQSYIT